MKNIYYLFALSFTLVALTVLTIPASAGIVQNNFMEIVDGGANHPLPTAAWWSPVATDLVNVGSAAYLSETTNFVPETSGWMDPPNPNVRNGTAIASDDDSAFSLSGWYVAYVLDTTANALGYDITEVDVYAAGPPSAPNSRGDQQWTLLVEYVDDPGVLQDLGTFENLMGGERGGTRIQLLTDDEGPIATGVSGVVISVLDRSLDPFYREFDVIGTATVPEPSSVMLIVLGAIAIFVASRHKG